MSDLTRIYDKLDKLSDDAAYLRGQWDSKLPDLASKGDIALAVNGHELKHHKKKSYLPAPYGTPSRGKVAAKIGVGTTGIGAIVYGIIQLIQWING